MIIFLFVEVAACLSDIFLIIVLEALMLHSAQVLELIYVWQTSTALGHSEKRFPLLRLINPQQKADIFLARRFGCPY